MTATRCWTNTRRWRGTGMFRALWPTSRGDHETAFGDAAQSDRRRLPLRARRPRNHGADERDGLGQGRHGRALDTDAGAQPCRRDGGEDRRDHPRKGHCACAFHRRRVRPPGRAGHHRRRGDLVQGHRQAGESGVDPRGRYPTRQVPPLRRAASRSGARRFREHRGLAAPDRCRLDLRPVPAPRR